MSVENFKNLYLRAETNKHASLSENFDVADAAYHNPFRSTVELVFFMFISVSWKFYLPKS